MYSKNAFTLVELIVWITISMLLMTSVWMLVSSGMQNILKQQNIMEKNSLLTQTVSDFYNGFENIVSNGGYVYHSQSWAIFQIESYMDKWGFWYLGVSKQSEMYCSLDSEFPNLNYLTWKSFIPYEEIWEDIFTNYSDINIQTVSSWSINYTVDTLNHQVLEDWVVIIWWDVFGHELSHWDNSTLTNLNNPTGIILAEWGFFLSDTLNHRILFYKDWSVYLLLDQDDWINQPTWLAYDSVKNILYIANSWKWEILELSAEILVSNPTLNIDFIPRNDINSISRVTLNIPNFSWNFNTGSLWDFTFNNINNWIGYTAINWNTIEYYFTDYSNVSEPITNWYINNCTTSDTYSLNWTTPERHIYTCSSTNTWTYQIHSWDIFQTLNTTTDYGINLQNITPLITNQGVNLVEIEFFNSSVSRYSDTFSYFIQSDGIVNNLENIKLNTLISWLWYPTGLNISWNSLEINDFITRKKYTYDLNNITSYSTNNLNDFTSNNLENIPYSKNSDILLDNPISEININYNNLDKFLSGKIKYYQYLNCYNSEEKVEKTLILQKNID